MIILPIRNYTFVIISVVLKSVKPGTLNNKLVNICSVVFSAKFIDASTDLSTLDLI